MYSIYAATHVLLIIVKIYVFTTEMQGGNIIHTGYGIMGGELRTHACTHAYV